jgi:Dyp-type peroxidase family
VKRGLDLADIQGNIVRPYGRFGFPITRHFFFNIADAGAGRNFVEQVRRKITTAERWQGYENAPKEAPPRPTVAINIGFSYSGLKALALPTRMLSRLPEEFIDGMAKRCDILGDIGVSAQGKWDEIWHEAPDAPQRQIHVWVSLNAPINPATGKPVGALDTETQWLKTAAAGSGGVTLLTGHRGPNPDNEYQDSSAKLKQLDDGTWVPVAQEHFGFTDGIADPAFAGQYDPKDEAEEVVGGGKIRPGNQGWGPLATGEFILGHASEAQELPPSAPPWSFMRNGTFMAYRKLHQNVASFDHYVDSQASLFQEVAGLASRDEAKATLLAKMVGRWQSGIPVAIAPTLADAEAVAKQWTDIPAIQLRAAAARTVGQKARLAAYERMLTDFRYQDDVDGAKCPFSAHIRRTNPRDALDPAFGTPGAVLDSALTNRRRLLRRGLPYGDSTVRDDDKEHGVIFMALCASLFRQFEFVQQQWVNYGAGFNLGNDTDPLVGLHRAGKKFVIPADPAKGVAPFICANIPQFVETRGGEYFFLPSLTALREIAQGSVDPT